MLGLVAKFQSVKHASLLRQRVSHDSEMFCNIGGSFSRKIKWCRLPQEVQLSRSITDRSGANVIKLFSAVTYKFL
jgi:hypothetical protein